MKIMMIGILAVVLLVSVFMLKGVPLLNAQSAISRNQQQAGRDVTQHVQSLRKPTQTRVPTRKATQTRVPTKKPSQTRVVTKTKTRTKTRTRTPPRATQTRTRVVTKTQTRVPTTTPSMIPTTTPSVLPTLTPTPVSLDPTDTIEFVNVGSSDWRVSLNGVSVGIEPKLIVQSDETYTFVVRAGLFHPLILSTDGSSANEYTDGVTPTGGSTSTLTITLSSLTPSTLYYVCANHPSMRGQLTVQVP